MSAKTSAKSSRFGMDKLTWLNRPEADGAVVFAADNASVTISPVVGRDFWSRTFYGPTPMIKADACALLADGVPASDEATLSIGFTLKARSQFDQAGAFIYVDESTWVKAGIEFCDGVPRLSVVVNNDNFSDWSTQMLPFMSLRLRVSKLAPGDVQGPALLVEAAPYEDGDLQDTDGDWQLVRIASLRSGQQPWRMGLFAAAPTTAGCKAEFHYLHLGPKLKASHSSQV